MLCRVDPDTQNKVHIRIHPKRSGSGSSTLENVNTYIYLKCTKTARTGHLKKKYYLLLLLLLLLLSIISILSIVNYVWVIWQNSWNFETFGLVKDIKRKIEMIFQNVCILYIVYTYIYVQYSKYIFSSPAKRPTIRFF